jgi:hypothetical protein
MLPTNFPPPVELLDEDELELLLDEDELELLLEEDEPLTVTLKACVLCAPQVLV